MSNESIRDDTVYLRHILECIGRIDENTSDGRDTFMASHTLQDAVLRNLQTMAESTQRLSESLKARYPDVEWRRIAAFRNILVHNYLGIDLDRIWDVVEHDVVEMRTAVVNILDEGR
jgi:uncharacterized protein with HEPN domain